jgi:hypothetical protein
VRACGCLVTSALSPPDCPPPRPTLDRRRALSPPTPTSHSLPAYIYPSAPLN